MKAYPKYKPSGVEWIGEIPEEWTVGKLKHHFRFEKGKNGQRYTNEYIGENSGEFPVYSGQTENEGIMGQINSFDYEFDSVLFVTTVGAKAMTLKYLSGRFALSQNCALMISTSEIVLSRYYYYYLARHFDYEKGRISLIMQPSLRFEDLNQYSVILPPLPEQTAIADFLDHKTTQIDGFIAKKQKLIELLREERVAVINHAVTKGLDPKAKMKPSGIDWLGEIPAHWEVKRLKFFANVNPTKCNYVFDKSSNELVVFLPMENVLEDGQIIQDLRKPINELSTGYTYFEKNDVIVAKITPCFENGKGALLDRLETPFGFGSTEFHTIRPVKAVSTNEFLYFLTKTDLFMKFGEAFMVGAAGQKRVPPNFVENFMIASPSLDEQNHIVAFLKSETAKIDRTIATIEKEIELIQEYRTALISEAVTGKIDVRG